MDDIILPQDIYEELKTASVSISKKKISSKKADELKERLSTKNKEHVLPTYGKVPKILTAAEKVRYNAIGAELFGNGQIVKKLQTDENAKWWETKGAQFANFMTQLRQKFLNLKTKLQTSFLWTVFKKGALILLLLFLQTRNWKISWEDIRKIPQKICNFVKNQLEESESLAKEYKPIGSLITNVKNAWEKFYTLIKSTNWKEIKKNINVNGLTNLLDNTSRAIANTIYKTIGNLNPVNWFNEDTEKEDAKMHAELMSTGDEGEMEQNILDKTITTMDELAYRQHGVALLQNKELAWVLKSVGNFIDKTIDTASVERANGNDKSQIISMGDTIIDYSSASQMQQDFLTARNEITKKAQTHIKSLSGMSSKEAMDEILAALEGKSTVLNDEDKKTLDVLFGVGESLVHKHFTTTRKEAAKALRELQSMTQKNISYTEKKQETQNTKEETETPQQEEKPEEKSIQQIIAEQRDSIQKSLDEADDMVSKLNGAVLAAFKNEKSVKSLIEKRDEVFPSKFIEDTKSFMNKNFNKPNDTISVENEKIQEHQGNSNSLTTVTVVHTKTESSALNNIITSIKNHREIIPKYLEKIQTITDKMISDREKYAES